MFWEEIGRYTAFLFNGCTTLDVALAQWSKLPVKFKFRWCTVQAFSQETSRRSKNVKSNSPPWLHWSKERMAATASPLCSRSVLSATFLSICKQSQRRCFIQYDMPHSEQKGQLHHEANLELVGNQVDVCCLDLNRCQFLLPVKTCHFYSITTWTWNMKQTKRSATASEQRFSWCKIEHNMTRYSTRFVRDRTGFLMFKTNTHTYDIILCAKL